MVVAIDGPAGAGKSTVAACVAGRCRFLYLNSGNFYRAITKLSFDRRVNPEDEEEIVRTAESCSFELNKSDLLINGQVVGDDIHNDQIDKWASIHSAIVAVRAVVNKALVQLAEGRNIIVEGRDMTTVVFPEAEVLVYLDASLDIRADRRFSQGTSGLSSVKIMNEIRKRDTRDRNKPVGKLVRSPDALYIDSSDLTIEEVCDTVVAEIHKKQFNQE